MYLFNDININFKIFYTLLILKIKSLYFVVKYFFYFINLLIIYKYFYLNIYK